MKLLLNGYFLLFKRQFSDDFVCFFKKTLWLAFLKKYFFRFGFVFYFDVILFQGFCDIFLKKYIIIFFYNYLFNLYYLLFYSSINYFLLYYNILFLKVIMTIFPLRKFVIDNLIDMGLYS